MLNEITKSVIILYKTKLINHYRNSFVFRLLFGSQLSINHIIITHAIIVLLYFALFYVLPFQLPEIMHSIALNLTDYIVYREFVCNLFLAYLFFMGMLVGMNMIFDITINENIHFLKLPTIIDDLVYYRLIEAILIILKNSFYFTLPLILYIAILSFSQTSQIMLYVFSYLWISFLIYFFGILLFLLLKRILKKMKPERLFVNIILGSIILFAVTVRVLKDNNIFLNEFLFWLNTNHYNIYFSPAHLVHNIIVSNNNSLLIAFSFLIPLILILILLFDQTIKLLKVSYKNIHLYPTSKVVCQKSISFITYNRINNFLSIIPIKIRPFIIKDILTLIRKPFFLLKLILFFLSIIILTLYPFEQKSNIDFTLYLLYIIPPYVISLLFINSIGFEKSNIYLIKRLFPSTLKFLFTRFQINLFCSIIVLFPILSFYSLFNFVSITLIETLFRFFLVFFSIIIMTVLVTGYSASFSLFKNKYAAIYDFGISPGALIVFWIISLLNSIFFYLIDILYLSSNVYKHSSLFIYIPGIVILGLPILFIMMGYNRIKKLI